MNWKNGEWDGEIISSEARIGVFHLYLEFGKTWFMSCYGVFNKVSLGVTSLKDAQSLATAKLQLKLEEAIKVITK